MAMKPFCKKWPAGFKEGDQVTYNDRPATVIATGRRVPAGEVPITYKDDGFDKVITVPADGLYPLPKRMAPVPRHCIARDLYIIIIVAVLFSVLFLR